MNSLNQLGKMKSPWILSLALLCCTYSSATDLCKQAHELGPYGISPWGTDSAFADPTARWLATTNDSVQFSFRFRNVHQGSVAGKLHVLGNAYFIIAVNGKVTGNFTGSWRSNDYTKVPVRFTQVTDSICFAFFILSLNM